MGSAESPEGRCRLAGRRAGRGAARPPACVCEARRAEGKATNSRFKTNLSLLGSFVRRKTDGAVAAGSQVMARSAPRARRSRAPLGKASGESLRDQRWVYSLRGREANVAGCRMGHLFYRPGRNANKCDSPHLSSGPRDRAFLIVCSVCFSRT